MVIPIAEDNRLIKMISWGIDNTSTYDRSFDTAIKWESDHENRIVLREDLPRLVLSDGCLDEFAMSCRIVVIVFSS
jgi:hypothetical protein